MYDINCWSLLMYRKLWSSSCRVCRASSYAPDMLEKLLLQLAFVTSEATTIFQTVLLEPQLQHSSSIYFCFTIALLHNKVLGGSECSPTIHSSSSELIDRHIVKRA